jgi:hypothetical protein
VIKTLTGIRINEFNYFNYAARTKIIPPTIPPFFEILISNVEEIVFAEGRLI